MTTHQRSLASFSGWHLFQYAPAAFPCRQEGCKTHDPHPNNYYVCVNCARIGWFESQIKTLRGDDAQRASTTKRLELKTPLALHPKTEEAHRLFRSKGGTIGFPSKANEFPAVEWVGETHHIRRILYPPHIPTHTSLK